MRSRSTEDEHRLGVHHWHVESPDLSLAVFERNVPTVHTTLHRRAGRFQSALRGGVIAVAELKLDDIAHGSDHRIRIESVLWSADYNWNELVLSGNCSCQLVRYISS